MLLCLKAPQLQIIHLYFKSVLGPGGVGGGMVLCGDGVLCVCVLGRLGVVVLFLIQNHIGVHLQVRWRGIMSEEI